MSTLILTLFSIFFGLLYSFINALPDLSSGVVDVIWCLFLFSISLTISQFFSYLITDVIFSKVKGKASSDLLRFIVSIILYTVSLTFVLKYALGWNLTALITTSALLTAVIGFALQATLGNLFAGVAIQLEQAFYIGDVIKIGDKLGRVETLQWRSMSIQTFDGTRLVIPNNKISTETVEIFPSNKPVRITMNIPCPMNESPETIHTIILKVIIATPNVYTEIKPFIRIHEYDTFRGIIWYQVRYFVNNYLLEHLVDATVKNRLWFALNRHHIYVPLISHVLMEEAGSIEKSPPKYPNLSKETIGQCILQINKTITDQNLDKKINAVNVYAYAPGELILYTEQKINAVYYIYKGIVKIRQKNVTIHENNQRLQENVDEKLIAYWSSDILNEVNHRLTYYIGPIAEQLVKTAAQKTLDVRELYYLLSTHIDDQNDKTQFLSFAPDYSFQFYLKDSWLTNDDLSDHNAFAQGETILLEIPNEN